MWINYLTNEWLSSEIWIWNYFSLLGWKDRRIEMAYAWWWKLISMTWCFDLKWFVSKIWMNLNDTHKHNTRQNILKWFRSISIVTLVRLFWNDYRVIDKNETTPRHEKILSNSDLSRSIALTLLSWKICSPNMEYFSQ